MKTKKFLAMLLAFAMVLTSMSIGVFAAEGDVILDIGDGSIVITETGYTQGDGGETGYSGDYIITQSEAETATANTITVGGTQNVTINGVNIDASTASTASAAAIAINGVVNLTLVGTNTVVSATKIAGVQVDDAATLIVTEDSTGSLTATGGLYAAGIGGSYKGTGGTITIEGGVITAIGGADNHDVGESGAGIGGGSGANAGIITINGGTITAKGGRNGAGIGGGYSGDGGIITINNGEINAYSGKTAAAIGGGCYDDCGALTINGGTINAYGATNGSGIGNGGIATSIDEDDIVIINGGTINAYGGSDSAGIGGGYAGHPANIKITKGDVTAVGGRSSAGIGNGWSVSGGAITIEGGTVRATGGDGLGTEGGGGAGIGSGGISTSVSTCNGGTIIISGGIVIATGGSGVDKDGNPVSGTSGQAGGGGAGIGGGNKAYSGTITITGGDITATGGNASGDIGGGSAIGGGALRGIGKEAYDEVNSKKVIAPTNITISGGTINVAGGNGINGEGRAALFATGSDGENVAGSKCVITGGIFYENIQEYLPDGYAAKDNGDNTYSIATYEEVIKDEAEKEIEETTEREVEITVLAPDADVENKTSAVLSTDNAPAGIKTNVAIKDIITDEIVKYAEENPTATQITAQRVDKYVYAEVEDEVITVDITPYLVITEGEKETEIKLDTTGDPVTVIIPLPSGYSELVTKVNVKHILDNGTVEEHNNLDVKTDEENNDYVEVAMKNGFSTWIVSPINTDTTATEIADALKIELVKHSDNEKVYDIMLRGKNVDDTASKYIYRWTSAEMDFLLTPATNPITNQPYDFEYKITPNTTDKIEYENIDGVDRFNMNGTGASYISAYSIKLGEIEFTGYGTFDFGIATPANAMAQTAVYEETDDSINRTYTTGADLADIRDGVFLIDENNADGDATVDNLLNDVVITETLEEVTIVIENNNKIGNQQVDYQDMTLTIDAKDNNYDKTIRFGAEPVKTEVTGMPKGIKSVEYDITTTNYTVKVDLPVDRRYTFKVEGAGYRTSAKDYTISGEDDAVNEVTFWNNAKQVDGTDFLAGEIVKDGKINIYDLSAVVSYFNTKNITVADDPTTSEVNEADNYYRTYDLNRDGKIDTIDISYLLLSWGK